MEEGKKLYPNCDANVWLRCCEEEVVHPLEGEITGIIPEWVNGTLLRNGPGSIKVGATQFNHVFDGSALLHRFHIKDGAAVTYQCRFVRSNAWQQNHVANRIVFTEFGTKAVPDPCHSIFSRFASVFKIGGYLTDNTVISVYPFGDEVYTLTEAAVMHRVDPVTLETVDRTNLMRSVIVNHTAHPHVMPNRDVYNLGMAKSKGKLRYVIVKFPFCEKGDMFEKAHVVCSVAPRWTMYPAYMHSFGANSLLGLNYRGNSIKTLDLDVFSYTYVASIFTAYNEYIIISGITDNYFVLVEQPFSLSLFSFLQNQIFKEAIASCLKWFPDYETSIVLVNRQSGETKRYRTDTLMFFHIVNSYEQDGKLVIDLCTYKDPKIIEAMYVNAIEAMQTNGDYATWCRSRPKRIVIALNAPEGTKVEANLIADISCEQPTINYLKFNGLPYRYFYGCGTDTDTNHACPLIKIDVKTREKKLWYEPGWSPGEAVFIAHPEAKDEDDGVLLSVMVRECAPQSAHAHELALLVLDARTMQEFARVHFRTPSPSPKCLHGWFLPEQHSVINT